MPKKILFILLIILLIAPRIAMASFFDDLLSRIRNLINNTNLNNNPTNEVNNTDQTINTTFNPSGFCFVKELEFGDRNSDVSELQKLLSQFSDIYPEKLVTGYFGNLTKQAVIRFQNKFKSEVLTPAGLKYGTGYVGKYTLNKLNSLNECLDTDQNNNIIDDSNSDLEINIDAQTEDEILEPTPTPDGNSDNPIDNNPPTTDSTLPTVKIKTYCSNVSSLLINSASMDSTPEKTDIRKMIFNFENPSYEDATNIVIDINGQTVNVGDINACQDEDYRKNVKSIAFDYQCKANEREVDVIVY
ncbi:MAG: peptidoglycan-binding domain-containing protein [Candidatus Pacebacteria bacterium]|nr:peptidoglycan-binding domain-containing protein [Candidatus Paceibacterota bacterium]